MMNHKERMIKFKTSMIRSNLCDYSDSYIRIKATITVANTEARDAAVNNTSKKVIFKNCALFTNYVSRINHTQVDDAQDIDIVLPTYNLIKNIDAYLKASGSLWQLILLEI